MIDQDVEDLDDDLDEPVAFPTVQPGIPSPDPRRNAMPIRGEVVQLLESIDTDGRTRVVSNQTMIPTGTKGVVTQYDGEDTWVAFGVYLPPPDEDETVLVPTNLLKVIEVTTNG